MGIPALILTQLSATQLQIYGSGENISPADGSGHQTENPFPFRLIYLRIFINLS